MTEHPSRLTVGVTTRNRPESLGRCVSSILEILGDLAGEILVLDDTSEIPAHRQLEDQFTTGIPEPIRIIRQTEREGYIVARNRVAREAQNDLILFLDDDTVILERAAVNVAVRTLNHDDRLVAVAFAQAEANGDPWPASMQPSPVDYPSYVPTHIGFAHLVRRDIFNSLGGYRELLSYYGEEKEFCLRALDQGYQVVYHPDARIAHIPDPSERDIIRYFRQYTRNDCFSAIYSYPSLLALVRVVLALASYRRTCKVHLGVDDLSGRQWLCSQICTHFRTLWTDRRPVRYRTLFWWRRLRRYPPPYQPPTTTPTECLRHGAHSNLAAS